MVLTSRRASAQTGLTNPPIYASCRRLEDLGVLTETTGRQRGTVWASAEYLNILKRGNRLILLPRRLLIMLGTGSKAPDFTLPNQDGDPVAISSLRGRPVVLYFYPKADAPG